MPPLVAIGGKLPEINVFGFIRNNAWIKYKREEPPQKKFGRAMESWRDYLFLREAFDQIFEVCEPNCSLLQNTGSQI